MKAIYIFRVRVDPMILYLAEGLENISIVPYYFVVFRVLLAFYVGRVNIGEF